MSHAAKKPSTARVGFVFEFVLFGTCCARYLQSLASIRSEIHDQSPDPYFRGQLDAREA